MGIFTRPTPQSPAPLDGADLLLADLDGVVYRGSKPIPHAVESFNAIQDAGTPIGYITNNASRTDAAVAEQLSGLGLRVRPEEIVTSPQAAIRMLREEAPAGSLILVVGGDGIIHELERAGYRTTRSADDEPDAVMQGFAPHVGWEQLAEASFALARRDIPWIATNQDWTIPVERGIAPGNGTLVAAVHTAVQRMPKVAGKPETPIFEEAAERFGARQPVFVGDRLDTDIKGARRAGMRSVLVLTGVDRPKQVLAAAPDEQPDYIIEDLRGLRAPYPSVELTREHELAIARAGRAQVSVRGIEVTIDNPGRSRIDLLRAASAAIGASEKLIYALRIPPALYEDVFRP